MNWTKEGLTTIVDNEVLAPNGETVNMSRDFRECMSPSFVYEDHTQAFNDANDPDMTVDTIVLALIFTSDFTTCINYVEFRFENRNVSTLESEIKWQIENSDLYSDFTYND